MIKRNDALPVKYSLASQPANLTNLILLALAAAYNYQTTVFDSENCSTMKYLFAISFLFLACSKEYSRESICYKIFCKTGQQPKIYKYCLDGDTLKKEFPVGDCCSLLRIKKRAYYVQVSEARVLKDTSWIYCK